MKRIAVALVLGMAACAAPHAPGSGFGAPPSVQSSLMQPDHGISALPGGWLPCGWPPLDGSSEGGDATAVRHHEASCAVAISTTAGGARPNDVGEGGIPGLHPADLARAYGFPENRGGMTVAIVDAFDDPHAESDLNVYRAKFHLPACTAANRCFRKVNQLGNAGPYPKSSAGWSHEIALDTEMVSAICPHCPILLVEANSANVDDLGASVDEAVKLGARVVSNSYYAVEWSAETSEDAHYNHPGVAITVSSGDRATAASAGGNGDNAANVVGKPLPYYPAASPYVTAVGGTAIAPRANGTWNVTPWKYAGQGCSKYEARPAFQPPLCAMRSGVDFAVVASPQTGVSVYVSQAGGWVVAGGTSVGAPIVAAAYALSRHPAGPAFSYAHAHGFRPVAQSQFDVATGLGTPFGLAGL